MGGFFQEVHRHPQSEGRIRREAIVAVLYKNLSNYHYVW